MAVGSARTALVVAIAATAAACATQNDLIDAQNAHTNTHTVLAFEDTVYNKHRVQEAYEHYVDPRFADHGAKLPLASETAAAGHVTIERTVAQGDLVAVHVHWVPGSGTTGHGIERVDIYRLRDARIVEHWGIAQEAGD